MTITRPAAAFLRRNHIKGPHDIEGRGKYAGNLPVFHGDMTSYH